MSQLPPGFVLDGAPAAGPVYGAPPKPEKPEQPKTTFRQLTPDEVRQRGLPTGNYQVSSEGNVSKIGGDVGGTVDEKKVATLVTRIAGSFADINSVRAKDPSAQEPGLIETMRGGLQTDGLLAVPVRAVAGENRRMVYDAQVDALDALLTLSTGAAYTKEQLQAQTASYFPAYGDSKNEIAAKNQRMLRLIESAKASAGPAWEKVAPSIEMYLKGVPANEPQQQGGQDAGDGSPVWRDENGDPVLDENGRPLPPEGGGGFDKNGNYLGLFARVTDDSPDQAVIEAERARALSEGQPGASDLARHGLTFGLSDEASGLGGAIGALFTGNNPVQAYQTENRAQDLRLERARQMAGWTGSAAEFIGALAGGGIGAAGKQTLGQTAKVGAGMGGAYGFGYGEGAADSTTNALLGAALGGTLAPAGQKATEFVTNRLASRAAQNAPIRQRGAEVAAAGQAEGVSVNRAMVDPNVQNRVTGVDASMVGGPRLQRGMEAIEGQIENRVAALGQGGTPLNSVVQGETIRNAAERSIQASGKAAKAKYDAAVKAAGDAKVPPNESMAVVDEMLTKLSELPNENSAEIAYLRGLKEDLSKNLSVGALRDLRTTLRKKISKGDLTFGQNEARVLDIMDAASNDIANGLAQQGKGGAVKLFRQADTEYRARMEYISGTLQKIIGKRNANLPAEEVTRKLTGMARGKDSEGVRKFLQDLTPDELADVRASFAEALGKNAKDEFTVTQFLRQTSEKNFPENSLRVVFGDEGAASIKRLRLVGQEVERVTGAMNSRTSKTAVANDYRSWLFNLMVGLAPGAASGNTMGALAGAATVGGIKAGRDVLSARALLSSDISKWIASAPRTTNPNAINNHIAKLGAIASGNSAYRMDARAIEEYLKAAITQSPTRAAAEDEAPSRREPPQQ